MFSELSLVLCVNVIHPEGGNTEGGNTEGGNTDLVDRQEDI